MNSESIKLLAELPSTSEIEHFLTDFFRTDKEKHYLAEINGIVADHFKISEAAYNLLTIDVDDVGTNAKSTEATVLGSRVGWVVTLGLKQKDVVKLVGVNTYEGISGPDSEMLDSSGQRAARTRVGVSYVIPSVKILKRIKKFADSDELLITALEKTFDRKLILLALEHVNKLPPIEID